MRMNNDSSRESDGRSAASDFDSEYDSEYDEENSGMSDSQLTENHDLPSVDEYKDSKAFREKSEEDESPKSRAGLYTFLCLLLLLIIITAIAVPLALRNKGNGNSPDKASNGGGSFSRPTSPGNLMPISPAGRPTRNPTRAPTNANAIPDLPRSDRAVSYLTENGIVDKAVLNDPTTPQAKATKWISDEDDFKIEIPNVSGGNNGLKNSDTRFTERWALAVFYFATGGEEWRWKLNFLQPVDHCDWYDRFIDTTGSIIRQGVTECRRVDPTEKVSKIHIESNNLRGVIPKEIEYFSYLQTWITPFHEELTLSSLEPFVELSGSLSRLELQYCNISGNIPESFGNMASLSYLGLGNNLMTGTIPESFFGLTNLLLLGLDDNLFESPIAEFAKLNKIQKLFIEDNLFKGQITEEMIDGWQSMVDLDISVNRLEGPLPTNIWSMESLAVVDLHGNDFTGQIPEIDSVHQNLRFFAVQDNSLDSSIPESINNLINLEHLDVSANQMSSPFPSTMAQLRNLKSLFTGINGFGDHPVPDFLVGMTNLKELSMKQNSLTGEIPSFLGGLTNLKVLDLDFNNLKGTIPVELGLLTKLKILMLNRNFLIGTIPDSFSDFTDIDILLLDANEISGNANAICENLAINMTVFSTDCGSTNPEIECSCCSICCDDSDADCNNLEWRVNLDGIWEYDFERKVYTVSSEFLPSSAKEDYLDDSGE